MVGGRLGFASVLACRPLSVFSGCDSGWSYNGQHGDWQPGDEVDFSLRPLVTLMRSCRPHFFERLFYIDHGGVVFLLPSPFHVPGAVRRDPGVIGCGQRDVKGREGT